MTTAGALLCGLGALGCASVLVGYPLFVRLGGLGRARPRPPAEARAAPRVTVIVAFSAAGSLLHRKIESLRTLAYPADRLDVILACDGALEEESRAAVQGAAPDLSLRLIELGEPKGKAHALNAAAALASGELLVFSDLDARVEAGAVGALTRWFTDDAVGGVCGQRVLEAKGGLARHGQSRYVDWDSRIKEWENRLGAITSNDGKLYAIRRDLFQPIRPTATDDLYAAVSVVLSGYRFLFDPTARAVIPPPASTIAHDFRRRRRVVNRSLSGLFARPRVFGYGRFGLFGPRLGVNKLLRRMMPVFLLGFLAGTALLAPAFTGMAALLAAQLAAYGAAALYPVAGGWSGAGRVARAWQSLFYACLGMAGMLVGVLEFAAGKRVAQWQPQKPT